MIQRIVLKALRNAAIIVAFGVLFSSCKLYKDVNINEISEVNFTQFSNDGIELEVQMVIDNPNFYKITMTEANIDIVFEGSNIGKVELLDPMIIPKNSVSTQMMRIRTEYVDIQKLLGNVFTIFFKSEYNLGGTGYIKGKVLFVQRTFPIEFNEKLSKKDIGLE